MEFWLVVAMFLLVFVIANVWLLWYWAAVVAVVAVFFGVVFVFASMLE